MKVTYYGQSCFLIEAEDCKVLFDPFITPNELAKGIDAETIDANYILVSHGHSDHTADLVNIARRTNAVVVCSFEIAEWLGARGISNSHPMNLGGQWKFEFGTVKMVYAAHSNSLPDGTYGGTAAGFIIRTEEKTVYYAGDTALTQDMKLTGEFYKPDVSFLPIGDNFTMGVDDAVIAAGFLNCRRIIGMHYDTFGYIKIDHEQAVAKFKDAGVDLQLIGIGKSVEI